MVRKKEETSLEKKERKMPFAVLRKSALMTMLGVTAIAGSAFVLTGCSGTEGPQGPAGTAGATWYSGTEYSSEQGKVGDFFYDTDDFNIYRKDESGWKLISNIKGPQGDHVVFRTSNGAIEWKYSTEATSEYRTLVDLDDITGADGDHVVLRVNNGAIEWKLSEADDSTYTQLITLAELKGAKGDAGKEVEFNFDGQYIEWRYKGETEYTNLVDMEDWKGADGKSAYEVAKAAGFEGDVNAWLASLKGVDGDYIQLNVTDTEIQWKYSKDATYQTLIALSELTGNDGDHAVLRVQDGKIEWKLSEADDTTYTELITLESISGTDGREVEFNFDGQHIEWRYKGETAYTDLVDMEDWKGADGKSAYEIAKAAGFDGDEAEWLESLKGEKGDTGNGIENIAIEYVYDDDGNCFANVTITYTDKTFGPDGNGIVTISVPIPKKVEDIYYDGPTTFVATNEEVALELRVIYDDNSEEYINITDDMFIVDEEYGDYQKPDFTTPGWYNVKIKYKGKEAYTSITVADPNDTTPTYLSANHSSVLVNTAIAPTKEDLSFIELMVQRQNGSNEYVNISDSRVSINTSEFTAAGTSFEMNVTFTEDGDYVSTSLNVLALEDLSGFTAKDVYYSGNGGLVCEINGNPFVNGEYLTIYGDYDESSYTYVLPASSEMLLDFDNTVESAQTSYSFNSSYLCGYEGIVAVGIAVYNPATATVMAAYGGGEFLVNTASTDDITIWANLSSQVAGMLQVPISYSALENVDGTIKFDTIGEYRVTFTYKGVPGGMQVKIYDPSVCNISSIDFDDLDTNDLSISLNGNIDEFITQTFNNQNATLWYYENVAGVDHKDIIITSANIDKNGFDSSKAGTQIVKLVYTLEGQSVAYTEDIEITVVVDMSQAQLVQSYTLSTDVQMWYSSIETYDNGFMTMSSDMLSPITTSYELVEEGTKLKYYDVNVGGYAYFALSKSDESLETCDCLDFNLPEGAEVQETFIIEIMVEGMPMDFNLNILSDSPCEGVKTYDASIFFESYNATFATVKVEYDVDNKTITYDGTLYNIDGDNRLVKVAE